MCGRSVPADDAVRWGAVRPGVRHLIEADRPGWDPEDVICLDDLAKYRRAYVENLIEEERGEIGDLESQVIAAMTNEQLVSRNPVEDAEDMLTFGQRVSDRVAAFGGSWVFIIGFMGVLTAWMAVNVVGILAKPFDPYPFILLNLVLSTLAALQAPIIMMSQKRQEQKDRLRAENDYRVNLKAELEIRQLHEKIDHQLARQWEKLVELQQIQIDLLEESIDERRRK
ncbi:MAG: DUF1003 domain-containing protein [Rhodobacteraceae bacterium]|nr:DUF1003 domain-containing protein [Paracoccaceae bacterium]